MKSEFDTLLNNETWKLVPYPSYRNIIGNKWVFRIKYNSNGNIKKYKSKLIAKGIAQKHGIDYTKTFSLVAKMSIVRLIIAIIAAQNWKIFKSIFLNGNLDVELYIHQPKGFIIREKEIFVCKLRKSLYGLKQAPRAWYEKNSQYFKSFRFSRCYTDTNLYIFNEGNDLI